MYAVTSIVQHSPPEYADVSMAVPMKGSPSDTIPLLSLPACSVMKAGESSRLRRFNVNVAAVTEPRALKSKIAYGMSMNDSWSFHAVTRIAPAAEARVGHGKSASIQTRW
jgi:hypothetical protein